ncbi:hypothetical protein T4C_822 [Trichinella pseudospiralis]|uniref:Uncharacterized protein n=1 Tax=Trichinella pseudospiralis TaxID=6337 RepID=A0A0V1KAQ2_TRIPS|nr:hypothetical protein T4C_822 [Trichinella pseudospiralis]
MITSVQSLKLIQHQYFKKILKVLIKLQINLSTMNAIHHLNQCQKYAKLYINNTNNNSS